MEHEHISDAAAFEAVRAHTRKSRELDGNLVEIPVPEWGFSVWTNPPTVDEESQIINARKTWEAKQFANTGRAHNGRYVEIVATIIIRGKHSDGSRIFKLAQLEELRSWMMAVTARTVANAITAIDLTPEELAKN